MIDLNMTNFYSSLSQLLQSNIDEVPDTPSSLFDLINAHKSTKEVHVNEDLQSLSDLASEHLNLKEDDPSGSSEPSNCSFSRNEVSDRESSNFNTLEEYTRSFLGSNSESSYLKHKPSKELVNHETQANIISEKLSNIQIHDSSQTEIRKIDLTAALLSSPENASTTPIPDCRTRLTECISYPFKECVIDVSALAEQEILCINDDLSHFGYVINKKWNCKKLPKKRKLGRSKPYNIGQSFKFDTPSPDDITLKARNRTISGSKD